MVYAAMAEVRCLRLLAMFKLYLHSWRQLRFCHGGDKSINQRLPFISYTKYTGSQQCLHLQQTHSGHRHQPHTHLAIGHPWELLPSFPV